jgi:hypothetical protein
MSFGLSVVVNIPPAVDVSEVVAIGERFTSVPAGDEPMDAGEALQFAFLDPSGVADLARLGITWEVYETGGK